MAKAPASPIEDALRELRAQQAKAPRRAYPSRAGAITSRPEASRHALSDAGEPTTLLERLARAPSNPYLERLKATAVLEAQPRTQSAPAPASPIRYTGPSYLASPAEPRRAAEAIETPEALGARLRARRREMGLSQQAFADLAGVGRRFVSELEAGKSTLEIGRVLKACRAAGLQIRLG